MAAALPLLLASCQQEELTDMNGASDATPLSITVTDAGFGSGSRAEELDGYATAFTEGDACGLYLVRDGRIVYDNVKLTATAGDDGAITWQPEEDLNGGLDGESYFLYYPYQSGLSAPSDLSDLSDDAFFSRLIAAWQPVADQSDYAAYTASDLMTAKGRIVRNGASKTVLSFDMTHRMALAVVELPKTVYKFTNPDISDYTVTTVADFTGSDAKPCRMADGSYRYIVNPFRGAEKSITGTYTDGSKEFTLTTGNMAVGHYKTYRVDGAPVTEKEHTLQAGDYFYSDGTIVAGSEADPPSEGCIGIVFWVGDPTSKDKTLKNDHSGCTHGLVVALDEITTAWQASDESVQGWLDSNSSLWLPVASDYRPANSLNNNIQGYNNTRAIEEFNANNPVETLVYAVQQTVDYRNKIKAPASSSDWYLPSIKELALLSEKDVDNITVDQSYGTDNLHLINLQLTKINATNLAWYCWSSTELRSYMAFLISFDHCKITGVSKSYSDCRIRPVLAF